MTAELNALTVAAASIGFFHTLLGSVILGLVGVSLGWLLSFSGCDLAAHEQPSCPFSAQR